MSVLGTVIVGIVILIGVIGAVVQIWPSAPVVGGAILVWAWMTGTTSAWIIFAVAALVLDPRGPSSNTSSPRAA